MTFYGRSKLINLGCCSAIVCAYQWSWSRQCWGTTDNAHEMIMVRFQRKSNNSMILYPWKWSYVLVSDGLQSYSLFFPDNCGSRSSITPTLTNSKCTCYFPLSHVSTLTLFPKVEIDGKKPPSVFASSGIWTWGLMLHNPLHWSPYTLGALQSFKRALYSLLGETGSRLCVGLEWGEY